MTTEETDTPMSDQHLEVSLLVHAAAAEVFALLRDPQRHPDLDGSGTLRDAPGAIPLTGVGDEFLMYLHAPDLGTYRSRSVVVDYEPNRVIDWSPGPSTNNPSGMSTATPCNPPGPRAPR